MSDESDERIPRAQFLGWMRNYNFKLDFVHDMIASITLAALVIPQVSAYLRYVDN